MRKFNISVNGKTYEVEVEEVGGAQVSYSAPAPKAAAPAPAPKAAAPSSAPVAGAETVTAPMPGTIVAVKVKVGDTIKSGDVLCVLEAMKMENEIMAPRDGKVVGVSTAAGSAVNSGDVLISIA